MPTSQGELVGEDVLATLRQVSTATLGTQLFRRGLRQQYLVGVAAIGPIGERVVGPAFTMRFIPASRTCSGRRSSRSRAVR